MSKTLLRFICTAAIVQDNGDKIVNLHPVPGAPENKSVTDETLKGNVIITIAKGKDAEQAKYEYEKQYLVSIEEVEPLKPEKKKS